MNLGFVKMNLKLAISARFSHQVKYSKSIKATLFYNLITNLNSQFSLWRSYVFIDKVIFLTFQVWFFYAFWIQPRAPNGLETALFVPEFNAKKYLFFSQMCSSTYSRLFVSWILQDCRFTSFTRHHSTELFSYLNFNIVPLWTSLFAKALDSEIFTLLPLKSLAN